MTRLTARPRTLAQLLRDITTSALHQKLIRQVRYLHKHRLLLGIRDPCKAAEG